MNKNALIVSPLKIPEPLTEISSTSMPKFNDASLDIIHIRLIFTKKRGTRSETYQEPHRRSRVAPYERIFSFHHHKDQFQNLQQILELRNSTPNDISLDTTPLDFRGGGEEREEKRTRFILPPWKKHVDAILSEDPPEKGGGVRVAQSAN